jgi:hypothetical protein
LSWGAASDTIANLAQASAIIVGGGWAFMKFVRGRTFGYRAELDLAVDALGFDSDPVLWAHVELQNKGLSYIDISATGENLVEAAAVYADDWLPDGFVEWDDAEPINYALIFASDDWLEPGESVKDDALLPVAAPGGRRVVAYRVTARVVAPLRRRIALVRAYRRVLGEGRRLPRPLRNPSVRFQAEVVVPWGLGASGPAAVAGRPAEPSRADGLRASACRPGSRHSGEKGER